MTQSAFLTREPAQTAQAFVGRTAALNWVAGQLGRETPQNCNIVGEPRIGKSSLLRAIHRGQMGLPPGHVGVYVWVRLVEWADRQPTAFWPQLLQQLHTAMKEAGLKPPELTRQAGDGPWEAYRAIEALLESALRLGKRARVIVLIDDFELLIPGIGAQGLDWLRALATRFASYFAFVMATTDPLKEVCEPVVDPSSPSVSPLHNVFDSYHLGLLTEPEALKLIEDALAGAGEGALASQFKQFLRNEAGRHPDLLKVGCDCLLRAWADEGETLGHEDMVDALRSDIRYDTSVRWLCERLLARRTAEERAMLIAVANQSVADDPSLLRHMERKLGLVEMREGRPALFADCWQYWLKRHATAPVPAEAVVEMTAPSFDYRLDLREIRVGDRVRQLSPVEDRLLRHLMSKPNRVCAAQELLDEVWGGGRTESVVEKTVNRLREKVEEDPARPRSILSMRGEGYMLVMAKPE